jgi:hypothetical protein
MNAFGTSDDKTDNRQGEMPEACSRRAAVPCTLDDELSRKDLW